jgi:hypothetical protein
MGSLLALGGAPVLVEFPDEPVTGGPGSLRSRPREVCASLAKLMIN